MTHDKLQKPATGFGQFVMLCFDTPVFAKNSAVASGASVCKSLQVCKEAKTHQNKANKICAVAPRGF